MKKTIAIATVVALACGGAGVAIGAATFARADDHAPRTELVRTTTRVEVPATPQPVSPPRATTVTPQPVSPPPAQPARTATVERRESGSTLRVRRLVLTRGIERREPVDVIDTLDRDEQLERVFAFVELANDGDDPRELTITFEREGGDEVTGHVTLEVPEHVGRWRTWAFTRHVDRAGTWRAVVRDDDGRELASRTFVVR